MDNCPIHSSPPTVQSNILHVLKKKLEIGTFFFLHPGGCFPLNRCTLLPIIYIRQVNMNYTLDKYLFSLIFPEFSSFWQVAKFQ